MSLSEEKTILIQEEILRHYRLPIYKKLLDSSKYDWKFVAGQPRTGDDPKTIEDGILPAFKLKALYLSIPYFHKYVYWQRGLLRLLAKEKIDVVIADACPWNLTGWFLPFVCKRKDIPLIKWSHILEREERGLKRFLKKMELSKFDAFLSYGQRVKKRLADLGFHGKATFVVYNSLDYDKQVRIRNSIGDKEVMDFKRRICGQYDPRLVVFVGRLTKEKRVDQLIHAIDLLKEKDRRVCCAIIGNGSCSDYYKMMIVESHLDGQVRILNNLWDEKDVGMYLMAADLSAVPCGAGLVVMHSFVYGTPVLTHNEKYTLHPPEAEVVVNKETGILYEENNITDLAEKMEEFLYPMPKKEMMSKQCMEIVDKYYNPYYQEKVIYEAIDYVLSKKKGGSVEINK